MDRKLELQAAIKAVEDEIQAVLAPLKERREQLYGELRDLELAAIAETWGFAEGDLIVPTPAFEREIMSRPWAKEAGATYTRADYLTVRNIDIQRQMAAVAPHNSGEQTGNIPFEVISGMRKAYLFERRNR